MPVRILLVDDEPLVVCALKRLLDDEFDVDTAGSGSDALEKMSSTHYAAVVSDMKMPDVSGAMVLKYACENQVGAARLLLTAQCDLDEQASAITAGRIHGMLYKPCSSTDLRNAIYQAMQKNSRLLTANQP